MFRTETTIRRALFIEEIVKVASHDADGFHGWQLAHATSAAAGT
ncbi:MAG TPA: hypothetical protein VGS27_15120 [Candidatus Sulfotelmatobacter sp.]|nr:hypothetical protein [Candidatus Sulfotelmatobacter sp.]